MEDLNFRANDPGAVKHGNFINYYQFHPPEDRMKFFPAHLWRTNSGHTLICLDIGCNSGDLTQSLFSFLSTNRRPGNTPVAGNSSLGDESSAEMNLDNDCFILAVDIDPLLIKRAVESNTNKNNITFSCLDFMNEDREAVLTSFLHQHFKALHFDVIFCFSITMWIHLNHGDDGLKRFLLKVTKWTNMLVIEPQPWKCYRTAVRRLKRSSGEIFPQFQNLKLRSFVDDDIDNFLQKECDFQKIMETPQTDWGRRLLFYKRKE